MHIFSNIITTFAPMYAQQSLQDNLFLMFYGGVAMLAFAVGLYLWLRRSNAIAPVIIPPTALRRWTAAFFIMAALSHIWWYVLGIHLLTDDRLTRNITAITLDHITLVPIVMGVLLSMLQDRQRRLWPWVLTQTPVIVAAAMGIARHSEFYGFELLHYWQVGVMIVFVLYYIRALRQYGRWLQENYADLEHKEVWQSLLFAVILLIFYEVYSTNPGDMAREYLSQLETLLIIAFLVWRVETLQELETTAEENDETSKINNIGLQLQQCCIAKQLYLQHDLTLQQLAIEIGTNRTYLSTYFAQEGITYNTYINRLRVEHFIRLYRTNNDSSHSIKALQLAKKSGFYSYSTFSAAFKKYMGITVTEWMKVENGTS